MAGKGDKRRKGSDDKKYRENWDKIFGKKQMNNGPDYKDIKVRGGNPCLEHSLAPYELCCFVETYPSKH